MKKKTPVITTTKTKPPAPLVVDLGTFAALCGRTRSTLNQWISIGMPTGGRGGAHGAHRIEVGPAVQWLLDRAEADAQEARDIAGADPVTAEQLAAARLDKLRSEARLLALDVGEREGKLVPAGEIEPRWTRIAGAIREGVLSLPAVLVQAGLVSLANEQAVDERCRNVLRELAAHGEKEALHG